MALDEERFPELIRSLYEIVAELQTMFPGRKFTPDGHMVGSLAECYAAYRYDLKLLGNSHPGHDAVLGSSRIEIKATQGKRVSLRSGPERLLVFRLNQDGTFDEIYNGPGAPVWELVKHKKRPSNGQYSVSLHQLGRIMETVAENDRLPHKAN